MAMDDAQLEKILVDGSYLTPKDLEQLKRYAAEDNVSLFQSCLAYGYLTDDLLGQAIAESMKVPYADLNSRMPSKEQVQKIPADVGTKHRVVLFAETGDQIIVTTDQPENKELKTALKTVFKGKKVTINYSLSKDIDTALTNYRDELAVRLEKLTTDNNPDTPAMLHEIFDEAIVRGTSDIHFEPRKTELVIRFRIDSVMHRVGTVPIELYDNLLNLIKVRAKLRIDQHHATQDGALRHESKGREVDMRVSIAPTIDGEKIVIRLLTQYVRDFDLNNLGLSPRDADALAQAIKKPFGMILVTGPTGSGKTTTLYALLRMLNKPGVNITTIEDPVEYKVRGVNQIKVNEEMGITFARGLRSIVRQDPDVILVGEIRDEETAEIAVNAALTGHLVLSTFHANDAATAIPRLLDMGVEPFLLSSTLELVVGQRLVRQISEGCKKSYNVKAADLNKLKPGLSKYFTGTKTLYDGSGCGEDGRPFQGRTGIFEIIDGTPELKDLILKNPSVREIWSLARKQGSTALFEDGVLKVKQGVTSIEELLRVAEPPHEQEKRTQG